MQPRPSQADIDRAMKALTEAPQTETGLIIPPHVAAQRQAEQNMAEAETRPPPNRRERRWQEKQARRAAKRRRP